MSLQPDASLVDSHCHIDFPELAADITGVLERMASNGVTHALCVSVNLEDFPRVKIVASHGGGGICETISRMDYAYELQEEAFFLGSYAPMKIKHPPSHYLKRMYHGMDDLKSLMDGPKISSDVMQHSGVSGQSGGPLGGFPWAVKLANRQTGLFQGFNTNLKSVVENLYDAADALREVKEKYVDVEHANAMSAAEMEADFTDAQSRAQSHNV